MLERALARGSEGREGRGRTIHECDEEGTGALGKTKINRIACKEVSQS